MLYILDIGFKKSTLVNFESGAKTTFVDLTMQGLSSAINNLLSKEDEIFILPDHGSAILLGLMRFMTENLRCKIIASMVERVNWGTYYIGHMKIRQVDSVDWLPALSFTPKSKIDAHNLFHSKSTVKTDDTEVIDAIGYYLLFQDGQNRSRDFKEWSGF